MPDSDKKVFTAKNTGHGVTSSKVSRKSKKKVNIILKNTIGPKETQKKVKIPIDTPISKLKARIAEVYGLDPNEFHLSHIPSKKSEGKHAQIKISKTPEKSEPNKDSATVSVGKDSKAPVRIVLRDRTGQKKFQKELNIPDNISIGELREEVAKRLNMDSDEFNLSLERYLD